MRELAKYSFINAKIRAMLSFLISPELFSRILDSKDTYEAAELLKDSPYYRDIVEKIASHMPDLPIPEKYFLKNDLEIFRKIHNAISTKKEKGLVLLFIERYELEQLKVALRIWHKKAPVNLEDFVLGERISFDIDYQKIVYSQNIEEIILLLDHTPYKKPLLKYRERFKDKGSIFYLEAGLDIDYYERLFSVIDKLSSRDRDIARKVMGIQIDIENINWLIRMRKYYHLAAGDMLEWIIPGGNRINKDNVISLYTTNGLTKIVDSVALGPYAKLRDLAEDSANLMENFLHQILLKEVKKALSGFPFTIGSILGFLILKKGETGNIISSIYAKNLGWKKDEVLPMLNI